MYGASLVATLAPKRGEIMAFPASVEAERSVLGIVLLTGQSAYDKALLMGLDASHFYKPEHAALWRVLSKMTETRSPIDMITVPETVLRAGQADNCGGISYVLELSDHVVSTANLTHYVEWVKTDSIRRSMIAEIDSSRSDFMQGEADPQIIADQVTNSLSELARKTSHVATWTSMADVLNDAVIEIDEVANGSKELGISTGFIKLDEMLGNLHPGDFVIMAGRPSMGKSAFAQAIAERVAQQAMNVAYFSFEMPKIALARRSLASFGNVNARNFRTGTFTDMDRRRIDLAYSSASDQLRTLYIDDTPGLTIGAVRARVRRFTEEIGPIKMIVIDYLQLMASTSRAGTRELEVSEMSRGAKALALEFNCVVIGLSQVSRACENRNDKRPLMSDLRESGSLEQDADIIIFLYRHEYYDPDDEEAKGEAEIIISKGRNGGTGTVVMHFDAPTVSFKEREETDDQFDSDI